MVTYCRLVDISITKHNKYEMEGINSLLLMPLDWFGRYRSPLPNAPKPPPEPRFPSL